MATHPAALGGGLRGAAGVRLARVRTMGLSELLCRSRQLAWSNLDRIAARTTVRRARQLLGGLARSAGVGGRAPRRERDVARAAERLLERFRESVPERFFSGAVSADTAAMLFERMPEAAESVRASADAVSRGRFDLLGYRQLSFGDPLDWHLDPTSGRRVPLKYWSPLRGVEEPEVGDCKVVWELNRHQWLVGLAQAYVLTADDAYASRLVDHIREWMRANPWGVGVNWASSLEVALRLISWCWALSLVRQSKALSAEFFLEALRGVAAHGSQVERYLSYYFSPNTHLTGEALGLFYAGIVFPGLRHAERWRALGTRILIEQLERQVTADGVYFEQSTCYQRYTVEIYLHFLILAARNAIAVPRVVHERVQRMLDFLLAVRRPDGTMPQIGDADGGWLLPLASRMPDDLRGIFSTAASVFGRSDYAWAGGGPAPETVWLLGRAGLERLETLAPAPPTAPGSRVFAEGGYAVMRDGWTSDANHLVFDVGPLGCPMSAAHGHADLLSIQCSAFGEPLVVDPGTYCYAVDPFWRNVFRSSAAHSTVTVDGVGQATAAGSFAWSTRPVARLRRWVSTERLDYADAEHDGYRELSDPVRHRRRVVFVKPRYWIVVDDLTGAAPHRVELRFQFAQVEVALEPRPWVRALGRGGRALFVRSFASVPLDAGVFVGQHTPVRGWISPNYGQRRPAPVLVYSAVARLPLRIVTLLYPTRDLAGPPVVWPLRAGGRLTGLAVDDGMESIRFTEDDVVLD